MRPAAGCDDFFPHLVMSISTSAPYQLLRCEKCGPERALGGGRQCWITDQQKWTTVQGPHDPSDLAQQLEQKYQPSDGPKYENMLIFVLYKFRFNIFAFWTVCWTHDTTFEIIVTKSGRTRASIDSHILALGLHSRWTYLEKEFNFNEVCEDDRRNNLRCWPLLWFAPNEQIKWLLWIIDCWH